MVIRLLIILAVAYAGACLLVFVLQRRMLYFPVRQTTESALQDAARANLTPWKDAAGRILGWMSRHSSGKAQGTLLTLHGNAGSALDRTYFLPLFQSEGSPEAWDVVLLEYPGYGPRDGTPEETALVSAAVEAIDQLRKESTRPVFVLGESLGSAIAALAVAQRGHDVQALLLVTPLKNTAAVARRHYPVIPSFLVRDTLRTDQALEQLRMPVAFMIAGKDEVVFPDLGMDMYSAYQGPKRLWVDSGAGHNTLDFAPGRGPWPEIMSFLTGSSGS